MLTAYNFPVGSNTNPSDARKHPVLSLIIYFALNNRWLQLSSEDILQENTWNQTRADDNKYGYVYIFGKSAFFYLLICIIFSTLLDMWLDISQ